MEEIIEAAWPVAGDVIYAGIDIDDISSLKNSFVLTFSSEEEMRKALTGKALIRVTGPDFS